MKTYILFVSLFCSLLFLANESMGQRPFLKYGTYLDDYNNLRIPTHIKSRENSKSFVLGDTIVWVYIYGANPDAGIEIVKIDKQGKLLDSLIIKTGTYPNDF